MDKMIWPVSIMITYTTEKSRQSKQDFSPSNYIVFQEKFMEKISLKMFKVNSS